MDTHDTTPINTYSVTSINAYNITPVNNYKDTPVTNTLKRKFIKRFNELTIAHNNGVPMTPDEAKCFAQMKEQSDKSLQDIEMNDTPQGCSTPIKGTMFPETSYHTPENQKFVYKIPDSEVYQTCLYMVPDNYQNNLRKKVTQPENFVELVMPKSMTSHPGLYEITKKDTSREFVFSPKMDQLRKKNPFSVLEDSDKTVLSKWKHQIKHVYEISGRKKNIELGENTVINLKKNLLFDDCDNILSRPKKICKRNRNSDEMVKQVAASPFSSGPLSDIDINLSRSDIRRKLNYSNHELSFEKENMEPLSNVEYKSSFVPISPRYNSQGEPVMCPKSPPRNKFTNFTKPKYSPNEFELRKKYAPHTLTSIQEENKLQVVPISPNEYQLRKEYVPHTITSEDEPQIDIVTETKHMLEFPELPKTPDVKFHPRPH